MARQLRFTRCSAFVLVSALFFGCNRPSLPPDPPEAAWAQRLPSSVRYEPPSLVQQGAPREDALLKAKELNQNLPPPKSFPRIKFRGLRTTDGSRRATFVMTNDTRHAFVYDGYAADLPVYELQRWKGHWEAASGGWCGVGLGPRLMTPSESIEFLVDVSDQHGPIRVGIRYVVGPSDQGKEAWSEEVTIPAPSLGIPPSDLDHKGEIAISPSASAPILVQKVPPAYPDVLAHAGITGRVLLKAVVDESGRVVGVEVVESSNPGFNDAALNAVMMWRYEPAMQNGRAVKVPVDVDVRFEMPKLASGKPE